MSLSIHVAQQVASHYSQFPQVEAVVLAGSQALHKADGQSDIDLYVYLSSPLTLQQRRCVAESFSPQPEVGNQLWEPGDEWEDGRSGLAVDVMFRTLDWIRDQLDRVLVRHEAALGYTTCLWHNVLTSEPLLDRNGWFAAFQAHSQVFYPEPLRQAILAKNRGVMRKNRSSYRHQIQMALKRSDWNSVNHRTAALLASYFDVVFAVNRLPHPGEKRLLDLVEERCHSLPQNMRQDVESLLESVPKSQHLLAQVDLLIDRLDTWIESHAEHGLLSISG